MSGIVVPTVGYAPQSARKPAVGFYYAFHAASGTTVPCAWGLGDDLVLDGAEGSIWATRGRFTPPVANNTVWWRPAVGGDYANTVMPLATPGAAFVVSAQLVVDANSSTAPEALFSIGRSGSSYALLALITNSAGAFALEHTGVGAGGVTTSSIGQPNRDATNNILLHCEVITDGVIVTAWVNGSGVAENTLMWTANSDAAPSDMSVFVAPGTGLSIGARGNTNTLTTYVEQLGKTCGNALFGVGCVLLPDGPDIAAAQTAAMAVSGNPRYGWNVLAALGGG